MYTRVNATAHSMGLSFSTHKTDLMHWRTFRDRSTKCEHPINVGEDCIQPASKSVKWLGFHFEANLSTWTHFAKRLSLAQVAFHRIKRLSTLGGNLSPYSAPRMAKAFILPTRLYGAEFLDPQPGMQRKMEVVLSRVRRWITNCFYTTNTNVLSAEACLMPLRLYLKQIRDMAIIRWTTALSSNNIAMALMPLEVPLADDFRFPTNRRLAFSGPGGMKPKTWGSASYTSVQKILPMDMIARRARILFPKWPFPRKPNTWLPPELEEYKYYEDTIKHIREAIHHKWKLLEYPEYYGYRPPHRTCWRFMTTHKLVAARLHQIRAGKSYLKAHWDWRDWEADPTCPRCESREETFHHVINECPSLATARAGHSDISLDISPESLVWSEKEKG